METALDSNPSVSGAVGSGGSALRHLARNVPRKPHLACR